MKINALFIENKSNLGNPQFAGFVERFDDVAELCAYALPNFFSDRPACMMFAKKLRECFDARGDEEGFFDSIIQTSLYGWTNTWKIVKNDIVIGLFQDVEHLSETVTGQQLCGIRSLRTSQKQVQFFVQT